MGLALFDGLRPVTTWPYHFIDNATARRTKGGGELSVTLNVGKRRDLIFTTMHAEELACHVLEQMDALSVQQASPTSSPRYMDAQQAATDAPNMTDTSTTLVSAEEAVPPAIDERRSIWIGGIPEELLKTDSESQELLRSADVLNSTLARLFDAYGQVVCQTTRCVESPRLFESPVLERSQLILQYVAG